MYTLKYLAVVHTCMETVLHFGTLKNERILVSCYNFSTYSAYYIVVNHLKATLIYSMNHL